MALVCNARVRHCADRKHNSELFLNCHRTGIILVSDATAGRAGVAVNAVRGLRLPAKVFTQKGRPAVAESFPAVWCYKWG